MPWFKIKHLDGNIDYKYEQSKNRLLFQYVSRGEWKISIFLWKPKKHNYKSLQTFFEEIESALQSGLQLNQAISHFATSSPNPMMASTSKAILSELESGVAFNDALQRLTQDSAAPYCQLLNSHGSREDCEKSLSVSILQLDALLNWSQRLLKSLIYPFCVIQIALIILIFNQTLRPSSTENSLFDLSLSLSIYALCSMVQLVCVRSLYLGHACYWLEKYSANFRLTKLFSLLSTTRKTGMTLQQTLKSMPEYFQYRPIKQDIYRVYYTLRLGQNYATSFPLSWFPNESAIALHSAEQDGDIERALALATKEHEKRWNKNIILLEKLIPAVCLLLAGSVVASALVSLYAPLIEMP